MGAWGGISTLGLGLSLLWTEGKKRGISIGKILEWTSSKTAEHAALSGRKAKLEVGYDADFVIWDPEAQYMVSADKDRLCSPLAHVVRPQVTRESLNFKNKLTPYEGMMLSGRVDKTYLRGNLVYDRNAEGFEGLKPTGKLL